MAKSKNASQHNQNKKAHKNGIHKVKKERFLSLKGVDPKFLRNRKRSFRKTLEARRATK